MALKALVLQRKIDAKRSELEAAQNRVAELQQREAELEASINEATAMEDGEEKTEAMRAVDEAVAEFEKDSEGANEAVETLKEELEGLENELSEQETEVPDQGEPDDAPEERKENVMIETREWNKLSLQEREAICQREDVQEFLTRVRQSMTEKRAVDNIGLTIPEVFLGMLRENIDRYSKLYKHVTVRRVSGTSRLTLMGKYDEAIWTECCANLNELSLTFYQDEFDCFKVGGYYVLCNANIEDSDLNLISEIMLALGQAIGLAVDKAILYGRNTSANQKMPKGVVTRLVETAAPSGYPQTARPWVDLHETNVKSVAAGTEGAELIKAIVLDFAAAKNRYSNGTKVFVMNEATYTKLAASTITTAADGSIVAGLFSTMPVIGGVIETLEFVPDNVIVAGYFDTYQLIERAGQQFATSEHVRFLNDQTVMKGTARYDGAPVIGEAFVAIGLEGVTPTSTMTFAADVANNGG